MKKIGSKRKSELLEELVRATEALGRFNPHEDSRETFPWLIKQQRDAIKTCQGAGISERDIDGALKQAARVLVIERVHMIVNTMSPVRLAQVIEFDDKRVMQALGSSLKESARHTGMNLGDLAKQVREFAKTRLNK